MKAPSTILFGALMFLAACAPPTSEITQKSWETKSRLSAGETVAVTGEHDFAECVSDALTRASPTTRVISDEEFRRQLFPWFEPATAPRSEEGFQSLLGKPLVSKKLEELGVRYAVFVRGSTREETFHGGVPYVAVWAGVNKDTQLGVSVWDLKSAELAGKLHASGSGTFLMLPIPLPAATESIACSDIASELAEFLGSEPSQGK
jgi:hypothetical protein